MNYRVFYGKENQSIETTIFVNLIETLNEVYGQIIKQNDIRTLRNLPRQTPFPILQRHQHPVIPQAEYHGKN